MEKYLNVLKKSALLKDFAESDILHLLDSLGAHSVHYSKNEAIFQAGEEAKYVGIVCQGNVQVVREDFLGNRMILANLAETDLFGETFACAQIPTLPVSVFSITESEILLMDYKKIIAGDAETLPLQQQLGEKMMFVLAQKNIYLNRKIEILSARTTREKLMVYFSSLADAAKSRRFTIPFKRQELADYLGVDRSAMTVELGKMQEDGLLRFQKREFELL